MKIQHYGIRYSLILSISAWVLFLFGVPRSFADVTSFVRVSGQDTHYLELTNGEPYIPIGLNLLQAWGDSPEEHLARMDEWIGKMSEQGGNYIRVWLSSSFWDIEHERSGVYDEEKAKRIDQLLAIARKHNVRVKLTLEHFRYFESQQMQWAAKPIHHVSQGGPAENIADFFDGEKSRTQFKKKLAWFADRYGNDPIVYGWELWNEVDCIRDGGYMTWTEVMLKELHRLFPHNLCMQSLGSFDNDSKQARYRQMNTMEGNDVAQVHRYLDLGAKMVVCHGPVDVLAAGAVREIRSYHPNRPVILAESGAVEPNHSGPFKLYAKDRAGIILHDVLFAPFFAGAAGTGQIWHWDHYVVTNNLWWHFGRFAEAVKGINPVKERFDPVTIEHPQLRVYVLKGKQTILLWLRDKNNTWKTELADGQEPERLNGLSIDIKEIIPSKGITSIDAYDPWKNEWSKTTINESKIVLPEFQRSLVLRIRIAD